MNKYKTLIFDLDDTLIDNNQSIKYAFTVMINELGLEYSNELFSKWKILILLTGISGKVERWLFLIQ